MPRPTRLVVLALTASLVVAARRPLARLARTIDQRAGIFAPHGARLYSAVAPFLLRPLYRRVADDVASLRESAAMPEISEISEIAAMLELGSGPGELALEVAQRLLGIRIVGVDLAGTMVETASARAGSAGLGDRVRFVLGDAAALPFGDETFEVSTLSLHHWVEPESVFSEIGRVPRPGGVALVHDLRPFAYSRNDLEGFLAGGPFEATHLERDPVRLGPAPALFVRIRLIRPSAA
jgi:SAM-dependent methyltransferase